MSPSVECKEPLNLFQLISLLEVVYRVIQIIALHLEYKNLNIRAVILFSLHQTHTMGMKHPLPAVVSSPATSCTKSRTQVY